MNRKLSGLLFGICLTVSLLQTALGQVKEEADAKNKTAEDSLKNAQSNEIVVTATRTEQELENVAIPVSVIGKKTN
jgi:outer membrane cobalamin receptor